MSCNINETIDNLKNKLIIFINKYISQDKKYIYIDNINFITIENILLLTYFYNINIIIHNSISKINKLYYYNSYFNKELPLIIIKQNNTFELVLNNNLYYFYFDNPLISNLLNNIIIADNKKLLFLNNYDIKLQKINIESYTNTSELNNDPFIELNNDSLTELNNNPITELNNEPITELNNEPITELNNNPITELNNEPITELNNEPITELNNKKTIYVKSYPLYLLDFINIIKNIDFSN